MRIEAETFPPANVRLRINTMVILITGMIRKTMKTFMRR